MDVRGFAEGKEAQCGQRTCAQEAKTALALNVTVFPIPLILAVDRVRHINYNILGLSHFSNILD